jgi:S-DNA-T family DNA segregation ATPase FtsK/SpoIIIE
MGICSKAKDIICCNKLTNIPIVSDPNYQNNDQKKNNNTTNINQSIKETAQKLVATLKSFNVDAKLINVSKGPTVTRYELKPGDGVKVSKIVGLSDDIALHLAACLRCILLSCKHISVG